MFAYRDTEPCKLIDVASDELGLMLKDGDHLTARRPYPTAVIAVCGYSLHGKPRYH